VLITVDDKPLLLKKGEIVFIQPNSVHSVTGDGKQDANLFIVSFVCKSRTMSYFKEKLFKVPEDARFLLSNIMTEAKQTFIIPDFNPNLSKLELKDGANIGGAQLIKINLEELLIKLIRAETTKPTSSEIFISKIEDSNSLEDEIIKLLQDNIYGTISLDEIASKLHYGKTTICKTFKAKTGNSIINYYLEIKIAESKKAKAAVDAGKPVDPDFIPEILSIFTSGLKRAQHEADIWSDSTSDNVGAAFHMKKHDTLREAGLALLHCNWRAYVGEREIAVYRITDGVEALYDAVNATFNAICPELNIEVIK
jgi:AraC-like DNA-binding protein